MLIACGVTLCAGCAAYRVGNGTLYAPDVATVYVPMIESDSFRRDLGERLTEAIVKEIELKTPYKVVGTPDAPTACSRPAGAATRSTWSSKTRTTTRGRSSWRMYAEVNWLNRRREPLGPPAAIPAAARAGRAAKRRRCSPKPGSRVAVQQQQAIQRLAEQIVATMEEPW